MGSIRGLGAMIVGMTSAAVLACGSVATADPTDAPATPASLSDRLDTAISAKLAEMGIPGAIVGVSIPGEVDYLTAVGTSDLATGAPMSVDDHSRIGSVTKTFTGTAVLQLVDQGRINLSDPISRYVDGVPSGDVITLDQLGRMRSGLFDYTDDAAFLPRLYAEAPACPDAFAFTPRQLLDIAFAHPLDFAPGTQYRYSNTNTDLLGLVVENVTGMPLGDYFAQNIFGPLGLSATSYPANGFMPEPFTHGYTRAPDGDVVDATSWNPSWGDAAGRIVSNHADLKVWAAALGRGSLLSPQTQAQRLQTTEIVPGLGYGFAMFNVHGWIGHNGDIPGYATVAVYLPERDATLVVLANSDVPESHSAGQLAAVVTEIVTPDHPYQLGGPAPTATPDPAGS
ncbi:MAG TPA: serine hydrolase domain-containing protein [Mycobacterium sp.]